MAASIQRSDVAHPPKSHARKSNGSTDLQSAVVKALDRDPPRHKGEPCRFAPCKINCPLWTAPMLQLAAIDPKPRTEMVTAEVSDYGNYLNRAKYLVDMLTLFKKEVDEQLHAYLEDGGKVPGWRIKAKVKHRQWVENALVIPELRDLGFEDSQIWQVNSLRRRRRKRLGVKSVSTARGPTNEPRYAARRSAPEGSKPRRRAVQAGSASDQRNRLMKSNNEQSITTPLPASSGESLMKALPKPVPPCCRRRRQIAVAAAQTGNRVFGQNSNQSRRANGRQLPPGPGWVAGMTASCSADHGLVQVEHSPVASTACLSEQFR
jgi:hypothetical protein